MVCAQEQSILTFSISIFSYIINILFLRISKKLHGCYKLTYDAIFAQT